MTDKLEDVLRYIKDRLLETIDKPIPAHCHCCPNPFEEALETERDYAQRLLDDILQRELDQ